MIWTYSCPHCLATLNPNETIVLRAQREGRRFLVGFHPQPGNYEVDVPVGEVMAAGTVWDFSCPVCDHSLVSDLSEGLCAIDLRLHDERHRVYFSRTAGEQATFVVSAEGLLTDHGIHTDRYLEHLVHLKYLR
jgi:hypothetical protein